MNTKRQHRWYLHDFTVAHWPGVKHWRTKHDALLNHGYASEEEALEAAKRITTAYAARFGTSGPDLRAKQVDAKADHTLLVNVFRDDGPETDEEIRAVRRIAEMKNGDW